MIQDLRAQLRSYVRLFARDLCVSDKNTYKVVTGISHTPRLRDKATFPEQLAAP